MEFLFAANEAEVDELKYCVTPSPLLSLWAFSDGVGVPFYLL